MIKYLGSLICAFLFCSCGITQPLYNWNGYDQSVYTYIKNSDEISTKNLLKIYEKLLKTTGTRKVPGPGVCADYGYLLIKEGEETKGKELLKREIELYPESAILINSVLKRFEK